MPWFDDIRRSAKCFWCLERRGALLETITQISRRLFVRPCRTPALTGTGLDGDGNGVDQNTPGGPCAFPYPNPISHFADESSNMVARMFRQPSKMMPQIRRWPTKTTTELIFPLLVAHFSHIDTEKDGRHSPKRSFSIQPVRRLPTQQGHGIRIGAVLEYLLRGMPFDVMKSKGRRASDSFRRYRRKHAQILPPYIQSESTLQHRVLHLSMQTPPLPRVR